MKENKTLKIKWNRFWGNRLTKGLLSIILIAILVGTSSVSTMSKSISNQEFFSYHVKDIVNYFFGNTDAVLASSQDFAYEKSIDGPLYGVAEGKNLIVIQVESFQNFLIGREYNGVEITPNLNKLVGDDSIYFDNYYMQVAMGNTSDAEFATNNSLYGAEEYCTYALYDNNHYRGLPVLLDEKGYDVAAFHGYKKEFWNRVGAYPSLGFDTFYSEEDFEFNEVLGFGIRDDDFFKQSTAYIQKMKQPFYSFLVTLSNHHPFPLPNGEEPIPPKKGDEGTLVYNYLNSARFTDKCIGEFIEELKQSGLYENSVIAIYGDHFGLTAGDPDIQKSMTKLLGKQYDVDEMAKIPLIIHIPGEDVKQTISISGGQLDFLPTIAYLMGFDSLDTLYLGQNLMTAKNGFVAEGIYFPKGSFVKDDIFYVMSKDGVFENGRAWNMKTGKQVDLEEFRVDSLRAAQLITRSQSYLKNDSIGQMQGMLKRPSSVKDPSSINKPTEGVAVTAPPEEATTIPDEVQPLEPTSPEQENIDSNSEATSQDAIETEDGIDYPEPIEIGPNGLPEGLGPSVEEEEDNTEASQDTMQETEEPSSSQPASSQESNMESTQESVTQ